MKLSRSHIKALAEKLQPYVKEAGGMGPAAEALGVTEYVVRKILAQKTRTQILRTELDVLASQLGLSIEGWDFSVEGWDLQ